MTRKWIWLLGALGVAISPSALEAGFYDSNQVLRLRAALGENEAQLALALRQYRTGDASAAFANFEPLLLENYAPAVAVVCDILEQQPGTAAANACAPEAEVSTAMRLEQLSAVAFVAREWEVLQDTLDRRLTNGDTRAHFDMARYEALSRPETLRVDAVVAHLRRAAKAGDPRGQYLMAVYQLHDIAEGAAQAPINQTFANLISQTPPVTAADAYFELAKLMQSGLVGSELTYPEVLLRADRLGNRYAAGHMAQYLLANPEIAEVGGQTAEDWVAEAAANGDPVAQYNHALALLDGTSSDAQIDEAERLLLASAESGFAPSHTRLGVLYWSAPERTAEDAETGRRHALDHWQDAADKGDANALYNLAQVALAQGRRDRALSYLEASAARGHEAASDALNAAR